MSKPQADLTVIKPRLLADLIAAARDGRVTHDKPVTARRICLRYQEIHGDKLSDVHVREIVNELRSEGHKIGSNANGYFYITDTEGELHTANQLESRMQSIVKAYAGMFPDRVKGLITRLDVMTHQHANKKKAA